MINWGYYLRYKSLEATFEKFVKHFCDKKEEQFQILSVGAGFDTTFFNVSKFGDNFKFYEVDLPSNVKRKTCLIQNSKKCCKVLKCPKFSSKNCPNFSTKIPPNFPLFPPTNCPTICAMVTTMMISICPASPTSTTSMTSSRPGSPLSTISCQEM